MVTYLNALSEVFPNARINNCFFHLIQAWRRKLCNLGFIGKLEKKNKAYDPEFRNFFDFISGIPNLNLHVKSFREKIIIELKKFKNILKFETDSEKNNFI